MSGRILVGVLAGMFVLTATVDAFGGRIWRGSGTVSYYYAAPIYYYCPPVASPRILPVPDAPGMRWANPIPAPPSATNEPPLQKKTSLDPRMPTIVTTHALGSGYVPGNTPLAKDRVRVGFWNLAGREVTLTVDGRSWTLPKDRAVTLDLDRQFSWQITGQPQRVERVPDGQITHEVVIRD